MGADGGSIPDRRDLVKTKGKGEQTDKALLRELYFLCALSKRPLNRPVVLDPLGKLYNKDAVLEFLLDKSKYGDGDQICGYLKGVKDLLTLNLTTNPTYTPPDASTTANIPLRAPFVCPLSLKEMSGSVPFIALRPCGCVFSEGAVRAVIPNLARPASKGEESDTAGAEEKEKQVVACPNCGKDVRPSESSSVVMINPPREVQEGLLEQLLLARAAAKSGKKRKAAVIAESTDSNTTTTTTITAKSKGSVSDDQPAPTSKSARTSAQNSRPSRPILDPSTAPTTNQRQSVTQKLAEQEQKRLASQAGMSDAVKSMFKPKEAGKTGGAADFFGRTFNRYA